MSPCLSAQFETNILPLYCGGNKIRKKERLLKLYDVNRLTMKILGLTTSSSNIFNHRCLNAKYVVEKNDWTMKLAVQVMLSVILRNHPGVAASL